MGDGRRVGLGFVLLVAFSCGGRATGGDPGPTGGTGGSSGGGSGGSPQVCTPGDTIACNCGGDIGASRCRPDGRGFTPCECPTGSVGGSGAAPGVGGVGGTVGPGGTGGSGGSDFPYTCFARQNPNPDPGGTQPGSSDCCAGVGTCATLGQIAEPISSLGMEQCSAGLLCAPKLAGSIPGLGGERFPVCHGASAIEGRCLPRCFALGDRSLELLGPGDCSSDLATRLGLSRDQIACLPCYDPLAGADTGICRQSGDAPVGPAPAPFRPCGSYDGGSLLGHCVPADVVPPVAPGTFSIPRDTCSAGELCAPSAKLKDPNSCFAKCSSPLGGEAACVPTYIVEALGSPGQGLSSTLGQVTCAQSETCVPCLNPLDSAETGACAW